jgi:hypothetical protein
VNDRAALSPPGAVRRGRKTVPVGESLTAFARAAGRRESGLSAEVFPRADHRIKVGDDFAPGHLATLTRWLSAINANAKP